MSYEYFIGALGAPNSATASAGMAAAERTHLSLVPQPLEYALTPDDPLWQEKAL